MTTPLESLVATGTKLWLDSVDPDLVKENRKFGATGATSNPIIISDLIKTGRFDDKMTELLERGLSDEEIAWEMTDFFVRQAQAVFAEVNTSTKGNDGYVSFELDPLLEDSSCKLSVDERAARYVELGKKWSAGHTNRMIKVPGTPGGLAALEQLAAAGITLNVTLLFTDRQYKLARDAVWRGRNGKSLERFKSVYSIFISRIDVYTKEHLPELSPAAQGQVGIVNAKRLWRENQSFWKDKKLPLRRNSSSPARERRISPIRRTSTSRPWPVRTSRRTRPPRTRRSRRWPTRPSPAWSISFPQGGAGRDRSQGRFQEAGNGPHGRGDAQVRRSAQEAPGPHRAKAIGACPDGTLTSRSTEKRVARMDRIKARSTTILSVRRRGKVALGGDGQVSYGNTIMKADTRKIRRILDDKVLVGFAGSTADAFALLERFETRAKDYPGNIVRAATETGDNWRTDRMLRRLEAMMVVLNDEHSLLITGQGDVVQPSDGIIGIGSGGTYALAAARALMQNTKLAAAEIVRRSLLIASEIDVYTNDNLIVEEMKCLK